MSEELSERVSDLEERVSYLERELDLSVEEERFERKIERVSVGLDDYDIIEEEHGGYTARVSTAPAHLPNVTRRVRETEGLEWYVKESTEDEIVLCVEQVVAPR